MLTSKICHKSSNFSTCSRIFWTETKWQECEHIGDEGWAHGLSCVETHPACRRGAPCRCCCSTKDPGWPGTWRPGEPPPPAGCWGWFAAHPPRASSFCRRRLDRWGGNRRRPSRLHFHNRFLLHSCFFMSSYFWNLWSVLSGLFLKAQFTQIKHTFPLVSLHAGAVILIYISWEGELPFAVKTGRFSSTPSFSDKLRLCERSMCKC